MAAALTLDIGYASDPDAAADGIDVTAGGRVLFTSGTLPLLAKAPAALASTDTLVTAKVMSAEDLVEGAKLVFRIAYKVPA